MSEVNKCPPDFGEVGAAPDNEPNKPSILDILQCRNNILRAELTERNAELAALREELNEKGWDEMMTRLEDQNDSLRQRLTVAEQRNAELSELLNLVRDDSGEHYSDNLQERILAALKPTHQIGVASK